MADDLENRGAQDRSRIDINEAHEVRYWIQRFDVTEEALRKAVAEVGVSAIEIAEHLGKR
jgi:hypothetical protein